FNAFDKCCDLGVPIEFWCQKINLRWLNKGLVTLDVNNIIVCFSQQGVCLVTTVGSTGVISHCHARFAPKSRDVIENLLVIGGYHNACNVIALARLFVYALYHGFTSDVREWLTGKPAAGKPGRNNT